MAQCLARRVTLIATIVCSVRPLCTVRHSGTWLGDLRKELRDVPERGVAICVKKLHVLARGMALKVLKIFSLLWQSFKGVTIVFGSHFCRFWTKILMLQKSHGVIERNWVRFSIQQPGNIQNQFTDLKQLKERFFVYQCNSHKPHGPQGGDHSFKALWKYCKWLVSPVYFKIFRFPGMSANPKLTFDSTFY